MSKRCRRRFLFAARAHFNSLITEIIERVSGKLAHIDSKAHQELSRKLTASLVDGEHVLFEDLGALGDYTLKRLRPRCRAFLELLLAENASPLINCLWRRVAQKEEDNELRVLSLGGGPGFDAIATLAALSSLQSTNDDDSYDDSSYENQLRLGCKVLDLAPAWAPAVAAVSAAGSELFCQRNDFIQLVAPIDLRVSDEPTILEEVRKADLVIAAYVLHENEADLTGSQGLGGALPGVFRALQADTPLVFLDATHRLWPALVETAKSVVPDMHVVLPKGLTSHIHGIAFIRGACMETCGFETEFQTFAAHQKANQGRLQRLQKEQSRS